MRKAVASAFTAMFLTAVLHAPANADAGELGKAMIKFPVMLSSIAAGTAVGTPIAITRKAASDSKETKEKVAGDGGLMGNMAGFMVGVPVGIVTGTFKGMLIGPKNAFKNSGENPFSADVFSLGDLD